MRDPAGVRSGPAAPASPRAGGMPLQLVRLLAIASVLALLGLIGWQAMEGRRAQRAAAPPPSAAPDQQVTVLARQNTHLRVRVDGEPVMDRALAGGESVTFEAHREIVVEVPAVQTVRLEYNGRTIVPQGRQDAPRRLVFVDDLQGGP